MGQQVVDVRGVHDRGLLRHARRQVRAADDRDAVVSHVRLSGLGQRAVPAARSREKLESLCAPLFEEATKPIEEALRIANVSLEDVDTVLLPVELVHPEGAGLLAGPGDEHALAPVRHPLPLALGHLGHPNNR